MGALYDSSDKIESQHASPFNIDITGGFFTWCAEWTASLARGSSIAVECGRLTAHHVAACVRFRADRACGGAKSRSSLRDPNWTTRASLSVQLDPLVSSLVIRLEDDILNLSSSREVDVRTEPLLCVAGRLCGYSENLSLWSSLMYHGVKSSISPTIFSNRRPQSEIDLSHGGGDTCRGRQ